MATNHSHRGVPISGGGRPGRGPPGPPGPNNVGVAVGGPPQPDHIYTPSDPTLEWPNTGASHPPRPIRPPRPHETDGHIPIGRVVTVPANPGEPTPPSPPSPVASSNVVGPSSAPLYFKNGRPAGRGPPPPAAVGVSAFETSPDTSLNSSTVIGSDRLHRLGAVGGRRKSFAQWTFYREPSPPPIPRPALGYYGEDPEHQDRSVTSNGEEMYNHKYDHVAPPAPIPERTVCGVRRRIFWIIFGVALFAIAVGVGVGVGVGLGARDDDSGNDADEAQDGGPSTTGIVATETSSLQTQATDNPIGLPGTTITVSIVPTLVPTITGDLPEQTDLPDSDEDDNMACPDADFTSYDVPGSPKRFVRFCGVDFLGPGQARDIGSVWTRTFEDCMINCAGFRGCTACSWGPIPGDPGSDHRCWLKSEIRDQYVLRTGWQFALLT